MEIVRACEGDMAEILHLLDAVFGGEQGIPCEMNPIPQQRDPMWWCVRAGGRIIAAAAVYRADGQWHMGRIAVEKAHRGRGLGTRLLRHGLKTAFAMGADEVHMEARDATVRIVRRMGGEIAGAPFEFYRGRVTPVVVRRSEFVL